MWYRVEMAGREVMLAIDRMDSQQWIMFSAVAIFIGAVFLRGYGSRTDY